MVEAQRGLLKQLRRHRQVDLGTLWRVVYARRCEAPGWRVPAHQGKWEVARGEANDGRLGAVPGGGCYGARCWGVAAWSGDIVNLSAAALGRPRQCAVKFFEQRFNVLILAPALADWLQGLVKPDE